MIEEILSRYLFLYYIGIIKKHFFNLYFTFDNYDIIKKINTNKFGGHR
ncbi:hypothetical protein CLOHIR_01512 [Peptacetobacter hiranonis DSM 13275]|uniref:Uncharacterized protein n=1 Tax=Peptacetobacter hiranonis (strain DSM 13275 / JCM 10541 / KCTC 15199 / TO-931) TaxID=500633 RepID=B6G056_PEPHT|nr:hypothetical protein CLOHIR_01512 [Peptacetobacter hiranonis DSM 13275]